MKAFLKLLTVCLVSWGYFPLNRGTVCHTLQHADHLMYFLKLKTACGFFCVHGQKSWTFEPVQWYACFFIMTQKLSWRPRSMQLEWLNMIKFYHVERVIERQKTAHVRYSAISFSQRFTVIVTHVSNNEINFIWSNLVLCKLFIKRWICFFYWVLRN